MSSNATGWIAVFPFYSFGFLVVLANVAHDLFVQVFDRCENSSGNDIALDLGEPQFHLIEPGGIGRGKVQMNVGMTSKELFDLGSLVRGQIVSGYGLELWIVGRHIALQSMGSEHVLGPHPSHAHVRYSTQFTGKLTTRPVSRSIGGLSLTGPGKNLGLHSLVDLVACPSRMAAKQARQPLGDQPATPLRDKSGKHSRASLEWNPFLFRVPSWRSLRLCVFARDNPNFGCGFAALCSLRLNPLSFVLPSVSLRACFASFVVNTPSE